MIDIIHGFTLLESGTKFEYIHNITNFSGHCHLLRFAFFSAKKKNPHCFVPVCRRCFYFNTFFVVGKMDSSRLMAIAVARYVTSYFSTSKKIMILFVSGSIVSAFFTFQGYLSILSCLGSTFQTLGSFSNNDKKLRQLMIIGTLFWLFHNYFASSPAAVLMEILFLSSNFIGYYRFYLKKQKCTN